jgi:ABC-2 type transport system permease protein
MLALIRSYLLDRRTGLLAYIGGCLGMLWMYIALFPTIQKQAEGLNALLQNMPETLTKAFNLQSLDYSKLSNFISAEYFSFLWPLIVIILVISWSAAALAGEVERGTIELLLAQPISRLQLYYTRYAAVLLTLLLFTGLTVLPEYPLAVVYGVQESAGHFLRLSGVAFCFGFAILGLSFLASAWFWEKGKVSLSLSMVLVLMYVVNIVSGLRENLDWLKYGSFFHYYQPATVLVRGIVDWKGITILLIVGFLGMLLGSWVFVNRDIAAV